MNVLVFEHEFVESKGSNSSNNESDNQTQPADSAGAGFMNIPDNVDDSGLPFNFLMIQIDTREKPHAIAGVKAFF